MLQRLLPPAQRVGILHEGHRGLAQVDHADVPLAHRLLQHFGGAVMVRVPVLDDPVGERIAEAEHPELSRGFRPRHGGVVEVQRGEVDDVALERALITGQVAVLVGPEGRLGGERADRERRQEQEQTPARLE